MQTLFRILSIGLRFVLILIMVALPVTNALSLGGKMAVFIVRAFGFLLP